MVRLYLNEIYSFIQDQGTHKFAKFRTIMKETLKFQVVKVCLWSDKLKKIS